MRRVKALPLPAVDKPIEPELAQIGAIKALSTGKASEHQQGLAWNLILRALCGVQLPSYRSDADTHAMAFMEGRRWVGSQLLSLATINTTSMKDDT